MDPHLYRNEIDRLSNEINTLKNSDDMTHTTRNIYKYKYHVLSILLLGLVLYIVKPICILVIDNKGYEPVIVVSKMKFIKYWIIFSVLMHIIYYLFTLYKKSE